MKKIIIPILFSLFFANLSFAGGYEVGEKVSSFYLGKLDGKMVSMKDFKDAKALVIIFTNNHCGTSKQYENLIIKLDKKYKEMGAPFIAINPSNPEVYPKESLAHMQIRAEKAGFTFPYLPDAEQKVAKQFGAVKTPQAFLLEKVGDDFIVRYIGQIDPITDYGAKDESLKVLSNAIEAVLEGNLPDPSYTKPGGCKIDYTE